MALLFLLEKTYKTGLKPMFVKPKLGFSGVKPRSSKSDPIPVQGQIEDSTLLEGSMVRHFAPFTSSLFREPARRALQHYNQQQGERLELVRVVKASTQVVCGVKHWLTVETINDTGVKKFYRVVFVDPPWIGEVEELLVYPLPNNLETY